MVNGVGRRLAQRFLLERALFQVKHNKGGAQGRYLPGLVLPGELLGKGRRVSIRHAVDEMDLAAPQGCQAHVVFLLAEANQAIQVRQAIAVGVGLKIVLKAHHFCDLIALPAHKLERPTANRKEVRLRFTVRRHEAPRIVHHIGGEGGAGLMQMAAHGILVEDHYLLQVLQRRAREGVGFRGIFHAREIPLHRGGIHLTAVVEQHAFAQLKGVSQQVSGGLPLAGNTRYWLGFEVQVEQTLGDGR